MTTKIYLEEYTSPELRRQYYDYYRQEEESPFVALDHITAEMNGEGGPPERVITFAYEGETYTLITDVFNVSSLWLETPWDRSKPRRFIGRCELPAGEYSPAEIIAAAK